MLILFVQGSPTGAKDKSPHPPYLTKKQNIHKQNDKVRRSECPAGDSAWIYASARGSSLPARKLACRVHLPHTKPRKSNATHHRCASTQRQGGLQAWDMVAREGFCRHTKRRDVSIKGIPSQLARKQAQRTTDAPLQRSSRPVAHLPSVVLWKEEEFEGGPCVLVFSSCRRVERAARRYRRRCHGTLCMLACVRILLPLFIYFVLSSRLLRFSF